MMARWDRQEIRFALEVDRSTDGFEVTRTMSRITADYDRGILTLRGTVATFRERQIAQDA